MGCLLGALRPSRVDGGGHRLAAQPRLPDALHPSRTVYFWPQHKWTGFQHSKSVPHTARRRHMSATPVRPRHLIAAVLSSSILGRQLEEGGGAGRPAIKGGQTEGLRLLFMLLVFRLGPLSVGKRAGNSALGLDRQGEARLSAKEVLFLVADPGRRGLSRLPAER